MTPAPESDPSALAPALPHAVPDDVQPTRAHIDLDALRHNVRRLRDAAGAAPLVGVVKADAYGHGAPPVVRALQEAGVERFAVATVAEGVRLRAAGVADPILVFAAPLPGALPAYAEHDLEVTVPSSEVADAVVRAAARGARLAVHVEVDTGMGRLGLAPEDTPDVVRRLERAPGVALAGLWTHFATADDEDDAFVAEQLARFRPLVRAVGDAFAHVHAANSAALLRRPESHETFPRPLVRAGIALYGLSALPALVEGLRPVMTLRSRVTLVKTVAPGTTVSYGRRWTAERTTRIATVGAGYADGYRRALTNRAEVVIGGRRYPVAGTVCMDMFMVDLGAPGGPGGAVRAGDDVVLFGAGGPTALDVAAWAETIPYEITCGVSSRVPRTYG